MAILIFAHKRDEFLYLCIEILGRKNNIPDKRFSIRIVSWHLLWIQTHNPTKMKQKPARPASVDAPEITQKKTLRIKIGNDRTTVFVFTF